MRYSFVVKIAVTYPPLLEESYNKQDAHKATIIGDRVSLCELQHNC